MSPQQRRYSVAFWDSPQKQCLSRYQKRRDPTGKAHSFAYSWRGSVLDASSLATRHLGFPWVYLRVTFLPPTSVVHLHQILPKGLLKPGFLTSVPSPTAPSSCSSRSGVGPTIYICNKFLVMLLVWDVHSKNYRPHLQALRARLWTMLLICSGAVGFYPEAGLTEW